MWERKCPHKIRRIIKKKNIVTTLETSYEKVQISLCIKLNGKVVDVIELVKDIFVCFLRGQEWQKKLSRFLIQEIKLF